MLFNIQVTPLLTIPTIQHLMTADTTKGYEEHKIRCCKMKFRHAEVAEATASICFLFPAWNGFKDTEAVCLHTQDPLFPTAPAETTTLKDASHMGTKLKSASKHDPTRNALILTLDKIRLFQAVTIFVLVDRRHLAPTSPRPLLNLTQELQPFPNRLFFLLNTSTKASKKKKKKPKHTALAPPSITPSCCSYTAPQTFIFYLQCLLPGEVANPSLWAVRKSLAIIPKSSWTGLSLLLLWVHPAQSHCPPSCQLLHWGPVQYFTGLPEKRPWGMGGERKSTWKIFSWR